MDWHPKPLDPADVTVHRRGRGKPLVLLHCLGMDWHFWDVLEPLAGQFEPLGQPRPAVMPRQERRRSQRPSLASAVPLVRGAGLAAQRLRGKKPPRGR